MNIPCATPLRVDPLPLKPTVCGLLSALSVIVMLADTEDVPGGVKVTVMAQLDPGLRLAPQPLFMVKADALVPPSVTPEIVSVADPPLLSVSCSDALVVLSFHEPKSRLFVERFAPGAGIKAAPEPQPLSRSSRDAAAAA